MKSFASKLVPLACASIVCGIALAGGGKGDNMSLMDANGDGRITAAEHDAGASKMFSKMDSDKDGNVTAAEMDAAHAKMMKDHRKDSMARNDDANKAHGQMDHGKMDKMSSSARIAKMDTNGDGQLSAAEHAAGARQMFSKMDKNGDGALTAQEMRDGQRDMMASDY